MVRKIIDNKFIQFIVGLFRTVFAVGLVCYILFIVLQRVSGNGSILGYRMFTVATGSMSGVYEINDVIAVKDCDTSLLKVGDDIAYQGKRGGVEGLLITHRIIKIENDASGKRLFTTKGVNAPSEDPVVQEEQVLGKVIGVVPVISFLNHIVKTQLGFFLLIFCPLVVVIVLEVLQTITDIQLDKNEIQEIKRDKEVPAPEEKKKDYIDDTEVI